MVAEGGSKINQITEKGVWEQRGAVIKSGVGVRGSQVCAYYINIIISINDNDDDNNNNNNSNNNNNNDNNKKILAWLSRCRCYKHINVY